MAGDSPNMNLELLSARVTIKKTMSAKLTTHEERQQGAYACIEHHAAAKKNLSLMNPGGPSQQEMTMCSLK